MLLLRVRDVPRTNDQSSSEASGGASSSVGRPTAWWAPVIVTPVASFTGSVPVGSQSAGPPPSSSLYLK